jgi:hypothetical protein
VRISAQQYMSSLPIVDDVGNDITEIMFSKSFVCLRSLGQGNVQYLYFMDDTNVYYNIKLYTVQLMHTNYIKLWNY